MFGDNLILQIIFCVVIGYAFGMFSSGYFIGKKYHVDVKSKGSGNLGTTNVLRTVGLKAGIITLVIDLLKTIIPILLTRYVFFPQYLPFSRMNQLLFLYTAAGAVCGHLYPFYLKFKGGKGIACMGACMIFFDWRLFVIGLAGFLLINFTTKYMSLASLFAAVWFLVFVAIFYPGDWHMIIVTSFFTISAFINHRENIKRLINHNENKITVKKNDSKD